MLLVALPSLFHPQIALSEPPSLTERLTASILSEPSVVPTITEPPLPAWLVGTWDCEQTLQSFTTPLGVQFIGAAGRPVSEAQASVAETLRQIGKPVQLQLRFHSVPGGAREDRQFNARSRLDADI